MICQISGIYIRILGYLETKGILFTFLFSDIRKNKDTILCEDSNKKYYKLQLRPFIYIALHIRILNSSLANLG
jgi:hypothetical protein